MAMALAAGLFAAPALEARPRQPSTWRGPNPVERAMADLDRAWRNARFIDNHERQHFERAIGELMRFEERWREGRFDKGRLDKAIDNIKHLVESRRVHPADRRILAGDLANLRAFRANRGYAGGYGGYWGPRG